MGIVIVADSSACLPRAFLERHRIRIVPLALAIDSETIPDGTLSARDLFARIDVADGPPKSAAPAPGEFAAAFQAAFEGGADGVLCLTLSAAYSGTYASAVAGAALVPENVTGLPLRVVDSGGLAMTHGFAVLATAQAIEGGASLEEAEAVATRVGAGGQLVGALDTMRYLVKSGRVPRVVGWAAEALSIKQMFAFDGGKARSIGRARTMARACERLVDHAGRMTNDRVARLAVMHTGAAEMAETLLEMASGRLRPEEAMVTEFTSVMAAHTGPGFVGLALSGE